MVKNEHYNCNTGSRVMAIFLNWWIFPIGQNGEVSRWQTCKNHFFVNSEIFVNTDLAGGKRVNYDKFDIAPKQRKSNI